MSPSALSHIFGDSYSKSGSYRKLAVIDAVAERFHQLATARGFANSILTEKPNSDFEFKVEFSDGRQFYRIVSRILLVEHVEAKVPADIEALEIIRKIPECSIEKDAGKSFAEIVFRSFPDASGNMHERAPEKVS